MRGKYIAIIVIVATGLAVWIAVDLWRPVSQNLRQFDPEEVARLDTDMWRSYYDRERLKLFNQLAFLLRRQYRMPLLRSYVVGFHAAKAHSSSKKAVVGPTTSAPCPTCLPTTPRSVKSARRGLMFNALHVSSWNGGSCT